MVLESRSRAGRGQRAKRAESATPDTAAIEIDDEDTPYRKLCRMRWAALIQRVYEVDPLRCPKCGGTMRIIAFLEKRDQADVIESRPEGDRRSAA